MDSTKRQSLVDSVNPYIGSIGHLLTATSPMVMLPHSMAQVSPVFTPDIKEKLNNMQFSHEDIVNGGELVLKMTDKPVTGI